MTDFLVYQTVIATLRGTLADLTDSLETLQSNQIHIDKLRETYDAHKTMDMRIGSDYIYKK